jgi:transcriptional regulator with XRE-family HTH domain
MTTATSKLIKRAMQKLEGHVTQAEIAKKAGFANANMLSMVKHGKTRLPLDRVPAIAAALDIDPALLFRTSLADLWPGHERTVRHIFRDVLTENEWNFIEIVRSKTRGDAPRMTSELKASIESLLDVPISPYS